MGWWWVWCMIFFQATNQPTSSSIQFLQNVSTFVEFFWNVWKMNTMTSGNYLGFRQFRQNSVTFSTRGNISDENSATFHKKSVTFTEHLHTDTKNCTFWIWSGAKACRSCRSWINQCTPNISIIFCIQFFNAHIRPDSNQWINASFGPKKTIETMITGSGVCAQLWCARPAGVALRLKYWSK